MIFLARPADEREGVFREAEPLALHLKTVAKRAQRSLLDNPALPDTGRLPDLAWICGATHDFGKYTSFFQDKLPPKNKQPSPEEYGHHAFASALLGAFTTQSRYPNDPEAALLVYLAIHRHHGNLVTPTEVLPHRTDLDDAPDFYDVDPSLGRQLRAVHAQLGNIRARSKEVVLNEMSSLGVAEAEEFSKQEKWWEALGELRDVYDNLMDSSPDEPATFRRYWRVLLLFSALIDADKYVSATAGLEMSGEHRERKKIPYSLVDEHIETLKPKTDLIGAEKRLMEIRRTVYEESTSAIGRLPLEELCPGVLSLTAPTGSGKTLTALGCALQLRERVYAEKGYLPRIVYALPFVNVIDQNFEVAEKVLSRHPDYSNSPSSYLLKHHHLAPQAFVEDEGKTNDEALLLTESWESEIVVTTFVQLFESLVTSRNRRLKKLHNMSGAIVILDEVQSIPYEQWRLVRNVLTTLTEQLGCTILQMTATRPRILPAAREILDRPEKHFEGLSRTTIVPKPDIETMEDLQEFCGELTDSGSSLLVMLNTIGDAVELYRELRKLPGLSPYREGKVVRESGNVSSSRPIVHLSTNLTPWQRASRVRMLRECIRSGNKPVVVSTQVVEAGVDLDFDVAVRDQGPLDSIIQVAGRCNRTGSNTDGGVVYVVYLRRERGESPATMVYGKVLPQLSWRVFDGPLKEPEVYDKIQGYFLSFDDGLSDDLSEEFLEAMGELRFDRGNREPTVGQYRHIQNVPEQESILVEINERAKAAVARLTQLYERGGDRHAFREAYREIGPFVVAVSAHRANKNPPVWHDVIPDYRYIPYAEVYAEQPRYYDMEAGFKWDDLGAAIL
jgi:CRISPR-associated endonuclease/helicase Cas3